MHYDILTPGVNAYKANLHCHTTMSDGDMTPEQTKAHYQAHGYSIVAFTDHELSMNHSRLTDDNFLALTGYELSVNERKPTRSFADCKTTHLNLIAPRPDDVTHVCYDPDAVWCDPNDIKHKVATAGGIVPREDGPDFLNRIIREANKLGYLVTYNHPVWSLAQSMDYLPLEGLFGIEVFNTGCVRIGFPDSTTPYDELLRQGKRLKCLATDDNHNRHPYGHPGHDSLGGWVVVHAARLDYETVFDALRRGDFYSSSGPEIKALWIEDGVLHVTCSPARKITVNSSGRAAAVSHALGDKPLVSAELPIRDDFYDYVRVTVEDASGLQAWSNAVFRDQFQCKHTGQ
ncbi:MAG: PHP domain-containing protein [Kiritimatiellia bacterium]|jgi:hypothetical protein